MAKGSSGFSSNGNVDRKLTNEKSFQESIPNESDFKVNRLQDISQGSEEQIKLATKIRNGIIKELAVYATQRNSKGNPSGLYNIARQGKEAIINSIKNNPLVADTDGELKQQKILQYVESYKDLAGRIKRFNEIASNTSASYWIKNRTDQVENFNNKKLKKKIDGK